MMKKPDTYTDRVKEIEKLIKEHQQGLRNIECLKKHDPDHSEVWDQAATVTIRSDYFVLASALDAFFMSDQQVFEKEEDKHDMSKEKTE